MEKFGIISKLVRMVKACLEGSRCKIKLEKNYSEKFEATVGLKQGDALSPTLFNIALRFKKTVNGVSFNQKMHAQLAYADDVMIK